MCYGFKYELNTVSSVGVDRCCPNYSCFLVLGVIIGNSLYLSIFFIALLWRKRAQNARHAEIIVAVAFVQELLNQYPSVCNGLSLVINALFLALQTGFFNSAGFFLKIIAKVIRRRRHLSKASADR